MIAILAAISIVAYTGIQNRANKSAVSSDFANFAKKIEMAAALTGGYPVGSRAVASDGSSTGSHYGGITPAVDFTVTKSAYTVSPSGGGFANFVYCEGTATGTGSPAWAVVSRVKGYTGEVLRYSSTNGMEDVAYGGSGGLTPALCTSAGIATTGKRHSFTYGYFSNSGGWQSWVE